MNIFVVFGSKSDESTYRPICETLRSCGHEVTFEVISAHRNPVELVEALESLNYHVVVAGAGLAAHLPGVVASRTAKPVFGIPVDAHFGGLDSLFSIFQMPFGVPVISAVPGRGGDDVADFLKGLEGLSTKHFLSPKVVVNPSLLKYEYVNLELERARKYLSELKGDWEVVDTPCEGAANICLVDSDCRIDCKEGISCINVPIIEKSALSNPARALELFHIMERGGLWVGVNNTRNAIGSYLKFANCI